MALKHGFIPPNLLFNNLNPKLEPFVRHLKIPTTAIPWPAVPDGAPRRASVNSFGFGGANAHVILETYQTSCTVSKVLSATDLRARNTPVVPFVFSAASQESLTAYLAKFLGFLESNPDVHAPALAHDLFTRKSVLAYRAAFTSGSISELAKAMADVADDKASKSTSITCTAVHNGCEISACRMRDASAADSSSSSAHFGRSFSGRLLSD